MNIPEKEKKGPAGKKTAGDKVADLETVGRKKTCGKATGKEKTCGKTTGKETACGKTAGKEKACGDTTGKETVCGDTTGKEMACKIALGHRAGSVPCLIRTMVREDCPDVHDLLKACFRDPWSLDSLYGMFQVTGYLCLLAVEKSSGRILGFAGLKSVLDQADITDVAVAESSRGRGLGGKLLCCLLDQAWEQGVREVFLEVRASNEPALALYTKAGFVSVGLRKNYYAGPAEDGIVMRWSRE